MFQSPGIMQLAAQAMEHATARHAIIARNIANSDTPGYRAQDVTAFADFVTGRDILNMRQTRLGHATGSATARSVHPRPDVGSETSPDGNSVSIERELVRASEVRQQNELAMTVYKTSLDILRASLGRGR